MAWHETSLRGEAAPAACPLRGAPHCAPGAPRIPAPPHPPRDAAALPAPRSQTFGLPYGSLLVPEAPCAPHADVVLTDASTNQRDKLRTQRADFPARAAKILRQEHGGDGFPPSCTAATISRPPTEGCRSLRRNTRRSRCGTRASAAWSTPSTGGASSAPWPPSSTSTRSPRRPPQWRGACWASCATTTSTTSTLSKRTRRPRRGKRTRRVS